MASSRPKIGIFLGGGGAVQGFPEIIQLTELISAGIIDVDDITYIVSTSVGSDNAWNYFKARQIWEEKINSHNDIFCVNPKLQAAYLNLFKNIPVFPWKHEHKTWREFAEDCKLQVWNFIQLLKFIRRAYRSIPNFILGSENSPKHFGNLHTFTDYLFGLAKFLDIDREQALLDLAPIMKILNDNLTEEDFSGQTAKVHIMTRSVVTGGEHIFTNKKEDLSRGENYHLIDSKETGLLAIRAAISLRTLFTSVEIGGMFYCDDGMANPFPVSYAFEEGCDVIFAFVKNYALYNPGSNLIEAAEEEINEDIKRSYLNLKRSAEIRARMEGKKLYIIHPTQPIHPDLSLLSISKKAKEYTINLEKEMVQKWLKDNSLAGTQV